MMLEVEHIRVQDSNPSLLVVGVHIYSQGSEDCQSDRRQSWSTGPDGSYSSIMTTAQRMGECNVVA